MLIHGSLTASDAVDDLTSILTELQSLSGSGTNLVYQTPVVITQAASGRDTILALEAGMIIRLHALLVSANPGGTIYIAYDDDGAGTNEVALTGAFPIAAKGGPPLTIFNREAEACLRTAAGKELTLVTAGTAKVFGYAIVSKSAT